MAGKSSGWTKTPRAPHGPAAGQGEKLLQPPADLNNTHPSAGRKAKSLLAKEAVKMMTGLTVAGGIGGMVLGFISFFFFFFLTSEVFCCGVQAAVLAAGHRWTIFPLLPAFARGNKASSTGMGTCRAAACAPDASRCLPAPVPLLPQLHLPSFQADFGDRPKGALRQRPSLLDKVFALLCGEGVTKRGHCVPPREAQRAEKLSSSLTTSPGLLRALCGFWGCVGAAGLVNFLFLQYKLLFVQTWPRVPSASPQEEQCPWYPLQIPLAPEAEHTAG